MVAFCLALFLSHGIKNRDCFRNEHDIMRTMHQNDNDKVEENAHLDLLTQSFKPKDATTSLSRRDLIVASMAGLSAEAAWRQAVGVAATAADAALPKGTMEQLEAGRAVVIPNWLSNANVAQLRNDCKACFEDGHFSNFVYSKDNSAKENHDPWFMPSFYPRKQEDGPFCDPSVGNVGIRLDIKARMAQVKAALASQLQDRPTLANDVHQTHEIEYIRYDSGGFLKRHVDERHLELKRPNGSRLPLKPNATRRSVTWLVYLNDNWDADQDGGQLRVYERSHPAAVAVGARGRDLQIGWLTNTENGAADEPVFLDPLRPSNDDKESCMLYTTDANGNKRFLSDKPFPNMALYLAGGDALMMDREEDAKRFRLIDAPKSLVSSLFKSSDNSAAGVVVDGERLRDIAPAAGTLVMFDSVSLPHQVLQTNRERFGVQGWFHESLFP